MNTRLVIILTILLLPATLATINLDTQRIDDTVIYDTAYYTVGGTSWQPLSLDGTTQRGSWYISTASFTLPDDATRIAHYSCTWNETWDCGNDWQVTTVQTANETANETDPVAGQPWSDPATWPSGEVPSPGDTVTITSDMNVTLDQSATVEGIDVEGGTLRFAREHLNLTTDYIRVIDRGEFRIGTEQQPFEHKAVITLTGTRDDPALEMCGKKVICTIGGKLELHGAVDGPTWTQIDEHANAGDTTLTLEEPVSWNVGDEIVITSTSYDPGLAERRTVTDVNGNTVTLNESLEFRHYGQMQYFGPGDEYPLDERAEVMHLTRNIVIQGDQASDDDNFGGHVMSMNEHHMEQMDKVNNQGEDYYDLWQEDTNDKSIVPKIEGVEFKRMGQEGILLRYPFHWHLYGRADGSYFRDNSIHNSYQRCVTIHGTQNTVVENNVAFDVIGHCYFLEDGTEWNNTLKHNIGALIKGFTTEDRQLIDSDNVPSVYWWNHPNNDFIGNVAAGAYGFGFWLDSKPHPTGPSATEQISLASGVRYGSTSFGEFRNNVAHSSVSAHRQAGVPDVPRSVEQQGGHGIFIGGHNRQDKRDWNWFQCSVHHNPRGERCNFYNNTAYYNSQAGIWINSIHTYARSVEGTYADNGLGLHHGIAHEERNVFIALSDNVGNPGKVGLGLVAMDRLGESKRVSDEELRRFENQVGRSLPGDYGAMHSAGQSGSPLSEPLTIAGMDWQYDGAIYRQNVFINYKDTEWFDVGAQEMPSNGQQFTSMQDVMINSDEPYLPHGTWKDKGNVLKSLDGNLVGADGYREIREHSIYNQSSSWLIDETCTPRENGAYHICSGSSAKWKTITVDDSRRSITQEKSGVTVNNYKGVWLPSGTYEFDGTIQNTVSFQPWAAAMNETWVFELSAPRPLSTDPVDIPGINALTEPSDVTRVSSMSAFETGSDDYVTLYYDSDTGTEHIKLQGIVDYNRPIDEFFFYEHRDNGNEAAYKITLELS